MTLINGTIFVRESCEEIAGRAYRAREASDLFMALTDYDGQRMWLAWRKIAVMTEARSRLPEVAE